MRNFNEWIKNFRESIADYKYYVDFNSVFKRVKKFEKEIKQLDILIGSSDIKKDFLKIVNKNPKILQCIPLMLAKRENIIPCTDSAGTIKYNFHSLTQSVKQYSKFMDETGLFDLFKNELVGSVFDYLLGVETGLNSNARKNRGGHLMEDLVEKYILDAGFVKNKNYFKEMNISSLESKTGLDLSHLSHNRQSTKRFDFVIFGKKNVYAIECNFYASQGSKLNETAKSYKLLSLESKGIKGFKFVWLTDGIGWLRSKKALKETFDTLENLYCIKDLENGIIKKFK